MLAQQEGLLDGRARRRLGVRVSRCQRRCAAPGKGSTEAADGTRREVELLSDAGGFAPLLEEEKDPLAQRAGEWSRHEDLQDSTKGEGPRR